jgi:hypothetical protein
MNAQEEALRRLRAASGAAASGTAAEQRAAMQDAWQRLRASAVPGAQPHDSSPARARSRSRSRERRRSGKRSRSRKRKHKHRHGGDDDDANEAALLQAARVGDAAAVSALLSSGVRASAHDANRCTALHWCALFGHADAARALLQSPDGARLAAKRTKSSRSTPLHYAATCGHAAVAAALLDAGADEFAADASGATPVSLGLRRLQATTTADARLDALQAARDAARAGAGALASAAWEAAQAAGFFAHGAAAAAAAAAAVPITTQWAAYQAAWPAFEARAAAAPGTLRLHDVPWPFAGAWAADGAPVVSAAASQTGALPPLLLAALALPMRALREAVREERRRWHPDKAAGRLRAALAPDDVADATQRAEGVIRALNALADALSADGGAGKAG